MEARAFWKTGEMMEGGLGPPVAAWERRDRVGIGGGHQIPHPLLCPHWGQWCRRAVLPQGLGGEGSLQGTNTTMGRC